MKMTTRIYHDMVGHLRQLVTLRLIKVVIYHQEIITSRQTNASANASAAQAANIATQAVPRSNSLRIPTAAAVAGVGAGELMNVKTAHTLGWPALANPKPTAVPNSQSQSQSQSQLR